MIYGQITPDREAVLEVEIERGSGPLVAVSAVLDTGFTEHLTLPTATIEGLGLPFLHWTTMLLADGSAVSLEVYEAMVHWDNLILQVPVHAAEGDALVGMASLHGCQVTLQVIDGGQVRIERL